MDLDKCLGRYCGRTFFNDTGWSDCGACPAGHRVDEGLSECRKCFTSPNLYQWLYLVFMFILPVIKQFIWIFEKYYDGLMETIVHLICCFCENLLAVLITLLVSEPLGELNITSCRVDSVHDWYTVFFNPKINHTQVIHCAQEAVYPLYSIVFIFYLISLIIMLMFRVWIMNLVLAKHQTSQHRKHRTRVIYSALYLYPILSALHGVGAGLAYYAYPYLMLVGCLYSLVSYCVRRQVMTWYSIRSSVERAQHFSFIFFHFCMMAYSIVAVVSLFTASPPPFTPSHKLLSLLAVPLPLIFLLITEPLSRPEKIQHEATPDTNFM